MTNTNNNYNSDFDPTKLVPAASLLAKVISGDIDEDKRSRTLTRVAEIAMNGATKTAAAASLPVTGSLFAGIETAAEPIPMAGLTRNDGVELLYASELTWLTAEPGSGKSMVSTASALEMARDGSSVLYLDFEATERVFSRRLGQLGATVDDAAVPYLHYVDMSQVSLPGVDEFKALVSRAVKDLSVEVIVLDGYSVALSLLGLEENSNNDNSLFGRRLIDIAALGPAILIIDHIGKPNENQQRQGGQRRYSRGASSKLAITSAAIFVDVAVAPSVGKRGILHWTIAKDRHGMLGSVGDRIATIEFAPVERGDIVGGLDITLGKPEGFASGKMVWADGVAKQIMKLLAKGDKNKTELRENMKRTTWDKYAKDIIADLIEYGYIKETAGRGPAVIYSKVQSLTQDGIDQIMADKLAEQNGVENPF